MNGVNTVSHTDFQVLITATHL